GNDGSDLDNNGGWFASFCDAKQVISVSAVGPRTVTDNPNTPAYFTNYGRKSIDVAGPGGNADAAHGFTASPWPWGRDIASWVWSYCSKTRLVFTNTGAVAGLAGCQLGNRLTGYIGTSQATPHVAGLAALLVAQNGKAHPEMIKQLIEKGADDFGLTHDAFISHGRINVPHTLGIN
ncbi:MAG: peptidase and in kexin sedolisin, partial [Gemmatimonadetes bacterium]|nr:peptidase and in kexin sedolisin [Gemmatimonadota bacterium]